MSLRLSTQDVSRLVQASTVLVTPLSYENGGAWRRAVCRAVEDALGSEASSFALPIKGEEFFEGPREVVSALQAIIPPPEWVRDGLIVNRGPGASSVADWTELFDANAVRMTPFYNDVVCPYRLLAPIVLMADIAEGQFPAALTIYYDNERAAEPHALRRKQLLQLLAPSFCAGVRAYLNFGARRAALETLAESMGTGVMLVDVHGKRLYENRFLAELRSRDPEHERIRNELGHLAERARLFAMQRSRSFESRVGATADVRTGLGAYRLSATAIESYGAGESPTILLLVERLRVRPLEAGELSSRFRLTTREIEVAHLLRTGLASREIAANLRISVNTARRHIEKILWKLNVHSRAAAASTLGGN